MECIECIEAKCYTPVTIKAESGLRLQFLGIGRRVEVGERSSVTVTIKSAPHAVMTGVAGRQSADFPVNGVESLARLSAGVRQALVRCLPMSLRYPAGCRPIPSGRTGIFSVPVECPAINGRDPANRSPGHILNKPDNSYIGQAPPRRPSYVGRALSGFRPTWRLVDIWIVQNLARRPPEVCDALPDIGQASAD